MNDDAITGGVVLSDTPAFSEGLPGAVFAYRFDERGAAFQLRHEDPIPIERPDAGFVWIHLNLADERARQWLAEDNHIPEAARGCLLSGDAHQSLNHRDGMIWGVFVDVMRDFDSVTDSIGHLRFVMGENYLVSGRRHALQSIETTRDCLSAGRMLPGPAALFETLVDHATDGLSRLVGELACEIDAIEDRVLENHFHKERTLLGPLRRREVAIHRQLSGMLSIFRQLEPSLERSKQQDLHRSVVRLTQRIEALHHEVHSLMGRTRLLQEEISSRMTTETNNLLYALTVVTTVLLPPTLITGLFGMNTGGLPLKDSEWGFLGALLICCASSAAVFLILHLVKRRSAS